MKHGLVARRQAAPCHNNLPSDSDRRPNTHPPTDKNRTRLLESLDYTGGATLFLCRASGV